MLCSTAKTRSSSSRWLDRLRISRGFPLADGLDLEHFLQSRDATATADSPAPSAPPAPPKPNPNPNPSKKSGGDQGHISDALTEILGDLFILDYPYTPRTGKSARKQPNPRPLPSSASASAGDGSFSPAAAASASAPHSSGEAKKLRKKPRKKRPMGGPADCDLSTYSATDLTVIDTSAPNWKMEKTIFRKGDILKVRNKKARRVCRKKRRTGLVEKEQQRRQSVIAYNGDDQKELAAGSSDEGCSRTGKVIAPKESDYGQMEIPIRRPKFSRSPRVPAAKDSPLFRVDIFGNPEKVGAAKNLSD